MLYESQRCEAWHLCGYAPRAKRVGGSGQDRSDILRGCELRGSPAKLQGSPRQGRLSGCEPPSLSNRGQRGRWLSGPCARTSPPRAAPGCVAGRSACWPRAAEQCVVGARVSRAVCECSCRRHHKGILQPPGRGGEQEHRPTQLFRLGCNTETGSKVAWGGRLTQRRPMAWRRKAERASCVDTHSSGPPAAVVACSWIWRHSHAAAQAHVATQQATSGAPTKRAPGPCRVRARSGARSRHHVAQRSRITNVVGACQAGLATGAHLDTCELGVGDPHAVAHWHAAALARQ